jgi:hypothetical protein
MVERRSSADQFANNADVAEMGCSNQGRAVVDAGDQLGASAGGEQGLQRWQVITDGCNGHSIIALVVENVGIRPSGDQGPGRRTMALERRQMQRCAAVAVARIGIGSLLTQLPDVINGALGGCRVQPTVGRELCCCGRRLCGSRTPGQGQGPD